jgi:hypothetical protein
MIDREPDPAPLSDDTNLIAVMRSLDVGERATVRGTSLVVERVEAAVWLLSVAVAGSDIPVAYLGADGDHVDVRNRVASSPRMAVRSQQRKAAKHLDCDHALCGFLDGMREGFRLAETRPPTTGPRPRYTGNPKHHGSNHVPSPQASAPARRRTARAGRR